ncbi:Uncharacterized conserved protein, DUF305 family [Actinopolymorpha cephalotaxi]|uniref:Uncharacterized conserved protein, DUF305 family n=1 Tax=Actinopolymorpha cephalotaxi TaxID=504797 RepID=A0A1I2ZL92_9ACTN|nr:DUF305 domain-containing protein [Actinopolymorpha cephalotaxi]NYH82063.1 uncharacterized protein (DUF305 family) [Actinopolymorpha cephalotaxi]SFH38583.1 Uncharacterized conserved protein, DUF305 family [Actinopolymorpha cephalotaxi]
MAVATAIGALLTGCGPSDPGTTQEPGAASPTASAPAGKHNAQDVAFAQGMIPHHEQAVVMSELAATRASSPQVKALAKRIEKAQEPEIAEMTAWLKAWGEPVPSLGHDMAPHMEEPGEHSPGHGMTPGHTMPGPHMTSHGMTPGPHMPGMMDNEDMDGMRHASGAGFDRMFLQMMIRHHAGAIEMAKVETKKGIYPPAKSLAAHIATSQAAEITQMRALLKSL